MCAGGRTLLFMLTARPRCRAVRRMLAEGLQVLSSLLAGGAPPRLEVNECCSAADSEPLEHVYLIRTLRSASLRVRRVRAHIC